MKGLYTLVATLALTTAGFAQQGGGSAEHIAYQGYLEDGSGQPLDGTHDLTFRLYRGNIARWTETQTGVVVQKGVFNVELGSVTPFDDPSFIYRRFEQPLELGISVDGGAELVPRAPLTAVPYAMNLRGWLGVQPVSPDYVGQDAYFYYPANIIGGYGIVDTDVAGAVIGGGGFPSSGDFHRIEADYGTVGGGLGNSILDDNVARSNYGTIGGGTANRIEFAWTGTVGGGTGNRIAGDYGTVAGGRSNNTTGDYGAVAGGLGNKALAAFSAIGGGGPSNRLAGTDGNVVYDDFGTIAGGADNVGGSNDGNATSAAYTTIGGGTSNEATKLGATVAGGFTNAANGINSFVGGGGNNVAAGDYGAIPGGQYNDAAGVLSFAAGYRAKANHVGSFVWSDRSKTSNTDADNFASTGNNQFLIRAGGGIGINTNQLRGMMTLRGPNDAVTGPMIVLTGDVSDQNESGRIRFVEGTADHWRGSYIHYDGSANRLHLGIHDVNSKLATDGRNILTIERGSGDVGISREDPAHPLHVGTDGTTGNGAHVTDGGVWTAGSSRTFKEDFRPVDAADVLDRVAALPIYRWRYKNSDEGEHMGPVAEDFYDAFGLGSDERYIGGVDADGAALASIQALYRLVEQLQADNAALKARIEALESER